jgi:hypothetical protein
MNTNQWVPGYVSGNSLFKKFWEEQYNLPVDLSLWNRGSLM